MISNCISIWLNTSIDIIYERILKSNNVRPLFSKTKSKHDLQVLLNQRSLVYKEADIKIETGKLNKINLIKDIILKLKEFEV